MIKSSIKYEYSFFLRISSLSALLLKKELKESFENELESSRKNKIYNFWKGVLCK